MLRLERERPIYNLGKPPYRPSRFELFDAANKISYQANGKKGQTVFVYDIDKQLIEEVLTDVENLGSYQWSEDESFLIYSVRENYDKSNKLVKKLEGMQDRWPWFRGRSFLYKYD